MKPRINWVFHLYIGSIVILSIGLILWLTPFGAGISPDSAEYIAGAKSLFAGKGYIAYGKPETHFPPLYPFFISLFNTIQNNPAQAARILNALLFGLNMGLIGWILYSTLGRHYLTNICAWLIILTFPSHLRIYTMAWSEPLFISFSLVCLLSLMAYISKPSLLWLLTSALAISLAPVTRYIGLAFLPAGLAVVLWGGRDLKLVQRFRHILIWGFIACTPIGLLLVRNTITTGLLTDRSLVFHPLSMNQLKSYTQRTLPFLRNLQLPDWLIPALMIIAAGILLCGLGLLIKRYWKVIPWRPIGFFLFDFPYFIFIVCYMIFLAGSRFFFDASTQLEARILSPVFVFLLMGIISAIWIVSNRNLKPAIWTGFLILVLVFTAIQTPQTVQFALNLQKDGQGYSSIQWRGSRTIAFLGNYPEKLTIYSNGPDAIEYLIGKSALALPVKINPTTAETNTLYEEQVNTLCTDIQENHSLLTILDGIKWRPYQPTIEELLAACSLTVLQQFDDGTIYTTK